MQARSVAKQPEIKGRKGQEPLLPAPPQLAEEGVPATAVVGSGEGEILGGGFSEDVPVWPDEAAESAFLSEKLPQEFVVKSAPKVEADHRADEAPAVLPSLDSLVSRIPAEAREVLEELFRARFVSVKKSPKKALKTI